VAGADRRRDVRGQAPRIRQGAPPACLLASPAREEEEGGLTLVLPWWWRGTIAWGAASQYTHGRMDITWGPAWRGTIAWGRPGRRWGTARLRGLPSLKLRGWTRLYRHRLCYVLKIAHTVLKIAHMGWTRLYRHRVSGERGGCSACSRMAMQEACRRACRLRTALALAL
jgi:hypothetical protein